MFVVCKDGTYGHNCVYNCSGNCLNDSPCNRQNGHCEEGCKPGYANVLCNKSMLIFVTLSAMRKRFFSSMFKMTVYVLKQYVDLKSSVQLINDANVLYSVNLSFNWFTGCLSGFYGNMCGQSCSGHCLNNSVCDHIDGTCRDGCEAGYVGKLCNTCKIDILLFLLMYIGIFIATI